MNRIEREVALLEGAHITEARLVEGVPVLIVMTATGQELQVEAWQDPEGNGPGYLSIGKVAL